MSSLSTQSCCSESTGSHGLTLSSLTSASLTSSSSQCLTSSPSQSPPALASSNPSHIQRAILPTDSGASEDELDEPVGANMVSDGMASEGGEVGEHHWESMTPSSQIAPPPQEVPAAPHRSSRLPQPSDKIRFSERAVQDRFTAPGQEVRSKASSSLPPARAAGQSYTPGLFKSTSVIPPTQLRKLKPSRPERTASLPVPLAANVCRVEAASESLPGETRGRKRMYEEGCQGDEAETADTNGGYPGESEEDDMLAVTDTVESEEGGLPDRHVSLARQLSILYLQSSSNPASPPLSPSQDVAEIFPAAEADDELQGEDMLPWHDVAGSEGELWDDLWAMQEDGDGSLEEEYMQNATPSDVGQGDEGDEGDVLARLLARAEHMRRGEAEEPGRLADEGVGTGVVGAVEDDEYILDDLEEEGYEDGLLDMDEVEIGEEQDDRRARALAYLESLPLKLLSQIQTSLVILNERERVLLQPKGSRKRAKAAEAEQDNLGRDADRDLLLEDPVELGMGKGTRGQGGPQLGVELSLTNRKTGQNQTVSFPDDPLSGCQRAASQQRIAEIMRVAVLMYEAILTDTITTKRDIFYKDVGLFKTQATVDKLVDDIAISAGLKRQDFMVCATSKGLIASSALKIYLKSGEQLSLSATNASLIPPIERIADLSIEGSLDWVLIVEKDAVFQTLCGSALLAREDVGRGAIITGKGYPDLATLQLSAFIATTFPAARFYALVDADPHGLDILSVYTFGSQATRYSHDHADLALGDRLEWMGVKASEWQGLGVRNHDLLQLSDRDVRKAMAMLQNRQDIPREWQRELVQMLHLNRKAEIQVLAMRDRESGNCGGEGNGENEENGIVQYVRERLA